MTTSLYFLSFLSDCCAKVTFFRCDRVEIHRAERRRKSCPLRVLDWNGIVLYLVAALCCQILCDNYLIFVLNSVGRY